MARRYALLVFLTFAMALLSSMVPAESNAATATAAPPASSGAGGPPPGPPPEAIAACKGKTAGTQVSFSGRNGESFSGVCQLTNGVLAARPSGNGGPPPAR